MSNRDSHENQFGSIERGVEANRLAIADNTTQSTACKGRAEEAHRRIDEANETVADLAKEVKVMSETINERDRAQDARMTKIEIRFASIVAGIQAALFLGWKLFDYFMSQ